MLETVVGTNGILVPPDGYLAGVREICDEHGIVLIADEVMAGFGRCGEWFAVDRWGVTPDLICFAKGVNSGYVPLGGVVISRPHRRHVRRARLPRRAHVLRPPARLRVGRAPASASSRRRASSSTPASSATTSIGPRAGRDRRAPPERRRGARARRVLGASSSSATARPASRSCPTTPPAPAAKPMDEFAAACKPRACGRSPTSTASTSCRRARSATTRCATAWRSSTRRSPSPTRHAVLTTRLTQRGGPPVPSPSGPGCPPSWRDILTARSAQWALLDDAERERLGELADELLRTKRWEAATRLRADRRGPHAGRRPRRPARPRASTATGTTASARSSCAPGAMRRTAPMAGPGEGRR